MTVIQLLVSFKVVSFSGGVLGYIFKSSINSGVVSMVGGLILVPIISLFTKKLSEEKVNDIFACYEKTVTAQVKQKERLPEEK